MNKHKNYQESAVIQQLGQKHDIMIKGSQILILNGKSFKFPLRNDLGIKAQGKIDFLVNHKGYKRISTAEFY